MARVEELWMTLYIEKISYLTQKNFVPNLTPKVQILPSYMSNLKIFVPNMKLPLDLSGLTVN